MQQCPAKCNFIRACTFLTWWLELVPSPNPSCAVMLQVVPQVPYVDGSPNKGVNSDDQHSYTKRWGNTNEVATGDLHFYTVSTCDLCRVEVRGVRRGGCCNLQCRHMERVGHVLTHQPVSVTAERSSGILTMYVCAPAAPLVVPVQYNCMPSCNDCENANIYPKARFVSEFGIQSYPSWDTLSGALGADDWSVNSGQMYWRQRKFSDAPSSVFDFAGQHFRMADDCECGFRLAAALFQLF